MPACLRSPAGTARPAGRTGLRPACAIAIGIAIACTATAAVAQAPVRDAGPSFIVVRYASETSLSLYAGYGGRVWFGFAGLVQNPRSSYRESVVGVGRHLPSLMLGIAMAEASDGRYAQLYVLPSAEKGPVSLDATVQFYVPLNRGATAQALINPLNLRLAAGRVDVGATYLNFQQRGSPMAHGAGPSVRLRIPNGSFGLDLIRSISRVQHELRMTVQTAF